MTNADIISAEVGILLTRGQKPTRTIKGTKSILADVWELSEGRTVYHMLNTGKWSIFEESEG